jgi:hypothetical protein
MSRPSGLALANLYAGEYGASGEEGPRWALPLKALSAPGLVAETDEWTGFGEIFARVFAKKARQARKRAGLHSYRPMMWKPRQPWPKGDAKGNPSAMKGWFGRVQDSSVVTRMEEAGNFCAVDLSENWYNSIGNVRAATLCCGIALSRLRNSAVSRL